MFPNLMRAGHHSVAQQANPILDLPSPIPARSEIVHCLERLHVDEVLVGAVQCY